ncbi:hypothetical protein V8C35DRAFT_280369 [Trichoderma chlorosporum]
MKASLITSLISFGLLSLAQGVFSRPQEVQGSHFNASALNISKSKDEDWVPPENPATNDVIFSWCRDYNMTSTCSQAALKHNNLDTLDPAIKDQLEDVGAADGRCMLFRKTNCAGEHTAMFVGLHLWTKALCPKSKTRWYRQATSVRCCAGSPVAPWCDGKLKKPQACAKG